LIFGVAAVAVVWLSRRSMLHKNGAATAVLMDLKP
jgi:hypothetical protein